MSQLAAPTYAVPPRSPRLRKRWIILAFIAGALGAGVIWHWPVRPIWTALTETRAREEPFSYDGKTLFSTHLPVNAVSNGKPVGPPYVCHWDVETGQLLRRVELSGVSAAYHGGSIMLMKDQRLVLAAVMTAPRAGSTEYFVERTLHDAATGELKMGPFSELAGLDPGCSRDGRWVCFTQKEKSSQLVCGLEVRSASTGQTVVVATKQNERVPNTFCFAPDGDSLAVLWRPLGPQTQPWSISIVDLPSAVERKRFELPNEYDQWGYRFIKWDGRFLVLHGMTSRPQASKLWSRWFHFDTMPQAVGRGNLDALFAARSAHEPGQELIDLGPTWLAYSQYVEPEQGIGACYERLRDWLWTKNRVRSVAMRSLTLVSILNRPSGTLRYTLPVPVEGFLRFSPDGRRLASRSATGGIAVWDLDPWPRWPWMVLAGCTPITMVWLYRRWRIQRIRRTLSWEVEG